jgi:putative nucleotidyltransferase with HDIG domain
MSRLSILCNFSGHAEDIRKCLADIFEIQFVRCDDIRGTHPEQYIIVDTKLNDPAVLTNLKDWLKRKPKDGKAIFITDKASRVEDVQAFAIGATDVVHRPVDRTGLISKLWGDFSSLAGRPSEFLTEKSEGIEAAIGSLQDIFSLACHGGTLNPATIDAASQPIIRHIEAEGLPPWIDIVRKHHSQTYQHSLLVTGIVVSFGLQLGVSKTDRERLSFAGLLHDIGKARIPLAILEKPGSLNKDEIAVMRQHPQLGLDALGSAPKIHKEMTDMVLHHQEYLDGSGYPHGLRANEIPDLVRITAISDVFAALIERRSYKPQLSAEAAYKILLDLGPKLDKDLVREFRFVSHLHLEEN